MSTNATNCLELWQQSVSCQRILWSAKLRFVVYWSAVGPSHCFFDEWSVVTAWTLGLFSFSFIPFLSKAFIAHCTYICPKSSAWSGGTSSVMILMMRRYEFGHGIHDAAVRVQSWHSWCGGTSSAVAFMMWWYKLSRGIHEVVGVQSWCSCCEEFMLSNFSQSPCQRNIIISQKKSFRVFEKFSATANFYQNFVFPKKITKANHYLNLLYYVSEWFQGGFTGCSALKTPTKDQEQENSGENDATGCIRP